MTGVVYSELEREVEGSKVKITIQEITPELVEPVIAHMREHFMPREPLCSFTKLREDPVSLKEFEDLYRVTMKDGAGIVALMDRGDGSAPVVVGANATFIGKQKESTPGKGEAFNLVVGVVMKLFNEGDLFNRYGVDTYLAALGLSVGREYHGLGLGKAILAAREQVCRRLGIRLAATVFTAAASRHIAASLGYDTISEAVYQELLVDGRHVLKEMPGKMSLMTKTFW